MRALEFWIEQQRLAGNDEAVQAGESLKERFGDFGFKKVRPKKEKPPFDEDRAKSLAQLLRERRAQIEPSVVNFGRKTSIPGLRQYEMARRLKIGDVRYGLIERARVYPSEEELNRIMLALGLEEA